MVWPWQEIVAEYDRKAHKKNGVIIVTFTGSFRAMDDRHVAGRTNVFRVDTDHADTIDGIVNFLTDIRPKAALLDDRIEERKGQSPHERRYLYDD